MHTSSVVVCVCARLCACLCACLCASVSYGGHSPGTLSHAHCASRPSAGSAQGMSKIGNPLHLFFEHDFTQKRRFVDRLPETCCCSEEEESRLNPCWGTSSQNSSRCMRAQSLITRVFSERGRCLADGVT